MYVMDTSIIVHITRFTLLQLFLIVATVLQTKHTMLLRFVWIFFFFFYKGERPKRLLQYL